MNKTQITDAHAKKLDSGGMELHQPAPLNSKRVGTHQLLSAGGRNGRACLRLLSSGSRKLQWLGFAHTD